MRCVSEKIRLLSSHSEFCVEFFCSGSDSEIEFWSSRISFSAMEQLGLVDALALNLCSVLLAVIDMKKARQIGWSFGPAGSEQLCACYLDTAGPSNAMSSLGCLSCISYRFGGPVVVATSSIGRHWQLATRVPPLAGPHPATRACLLARRGDRGRRPARVLCCWGFGPLLSVRTSGRYTNRRARHKQNSAGVFGSVGWRAVERVLSLIHI